MEDFLKHLIQEAGAIGKGYFKKGVHFETKKHLGDLVTQADLEVSDFCVQKIQASYPDHAIYSEERKEIINEGAEYLWMIDPIDGTRNFAIGVPMWCVMIAVFQNDELYLAAIYNPLVDELFFAEAGKGATLNGIPLHVNEIDSLSHGYGIPVRGGNDKSHNDIFVTMMKKLSDTDVWMHNFGTMLGACYVASGGADFFVNNAGWDHDYAAATLICREAGAVVTDTDGNPWKRGRQDIVIANTKLHPKILELLHS